MTAISTVYDRIYTILGSEFSSKTEIYNPYTLPNNPDYVLENGYGVRILGSTIGETFLGHSVRELIRDISIVLTKKICSIEQVSANKKVAEKALLEDHLTLIKAIINDATLTEYIEDHDALSDTGIDFIYTEKYNYITTTINFTIKYSEFLK